MESLREALNDWGKVPMCWKCCHVVTEATGPSYVGPFNMTGCTADPRIEDYDDAMDGGPLWLPIVQDLMEKLKEARNNKED